MKEKHLKKIFAAALFILMLGATAVPAYANSAQSWFEGTDSTGAIMPDKESPIVVENEVLTFDILEFPQEYYEEEEEYLAYGARVTAQYTFYNPSEYTVTAKLLFPFGELPSYAHGYYDDYGTYISFADTEKYDVTVNGEAIEKKIRYTHSHAYEPFDLERDLALIADDYVADAFYSPDLPVTKYTFYVSELDADKTPIHVAIDVPELIGNYRIYMPEATGYHRQDDGDGRIHTSARVSEKIELYVFGTLPSQLPEWTFYKDGGVEDGEELDGKIELSTAENMTFLEFTLLEHYEHLEISEIDWYNATVAEMKSSAERTPYHPIVHSHSVVGSFDDGFMRWYEYEITLAPQERIVNTVTAPIYPDIDLDYEPDIYEYTYLLSPARTWKEFGELKIVINTPYYVAKSDGFDFEKTESGYTLTLDGLPDGELNFIISASENPQVELTPYRMLGYFLMAAGIAIVVILLSFVVGGMVLAVVLSRRKKRNKLKNKME